MTVQFVLPMFPDGFRNEVQVISMVMSNDPDCTSEMAAMVGSSLALAISDIPSIPAPTNCRCTSWLY
ncbi:Polyribonucleotide nucleotidyltransferase [Lysinibacillus sphaericus]